MKMEVKIGLNSRQWALYRYLKDKGNQWTTQFRIVNELRDLYGYVEDDFVTFHDSPARHQLTKDIRAINESDYIHKPILSGSKGVKLANKKEFNKYMASNIISTVNRLNRLKKLASKADKNGQFRLELTKHQKEVYESFVADDVS